jgi:hypothetical protein
VKTLTRIREDDATGGALEQAYAELGLKTLDALGNDRNGKPQPVRRGGHASGVRNLGEDLDIAEAGRTVDLAATTVAAG